MKTFLAALVAIMISVTAEAEPITRNKPVQCAPPIDVINEYILRHELDVMYIGVAKILTQFQQSELAAVSFWMNAETGKFLMLEGNKEQVCVLSLGDRMDFNITNDQVLGLYLQDGS
mgnify:FL=1|jgi:hypothetical protein|tara:strand:+ start:96 stop:446 length:351 start_codon:yes stop_codon:yes gene_type:complete